MYQFIFIIYGFLITPTISCLYSGKRFLNNRVFDFPISAENATTCQYWCSQEKKCLVFSFHTVAEDCFLHELDSTLKNEVGWISGPKKCSSAPTTSLPTFSPSSSTPSTSPTQSTASPRDEEEQGGRPEYLDGYLFFLSVTIFLMGMIGGAGWFKDGRYFRHVQLNQRCFENSHLFNIYHRGILIFADVIADIYMIYEMMHADQQDLAALSSVILILHSCITGYLAYKSVGEEPPKEDSINQKAWRFFLQFFHIQVLIEIFTSVKNSKSTRKLRRLKMWECVFNCVLQLWIQAYFFIVEYSGDSTPFAVVSIFIHIVSICATIYYTDIYGLGNNTFAKFIFFLLRLCDVTSRVFTLAIAATISNTAAWSVVLYFFLCMAAIMAVKWLTNEEGAKMREIEYGMLALFSYDLHYLNLTSFFFNFLKLIDTTIFVMIIGVSGDGMEGKVRGEVWTVLIGTFAVLYTIGPGVVKFVFDLDLYMLGRKHNWQELKKTEKQNDESSAEQSERYGVLKLLVKRGAIEAKPEFRRPFVLTQGYNIHLLKKHEMLAQGKESAWIEQLWANEDWEVLSKLLDVDPDDVMCQLNPETGDPEARVLTQREQYMLTKWLLERGEETWNFSSLEDLGFYRKDESMHQMMAGWLLKECADQVSWDLLYEKKYTRTDVIIAWRITQEKESMSRVCKTMDCKKKIGHEVMKFLLYEVRMKWWLKDLWESVESREDLYQELLRAIPFKGETEKEKLERGKEVLAPYLRGENPGKPKTSYLQNSDAESSSDEDESSTYDQKKVISIKISKDPSMDTAE